MWRKKKQLNLSNIAVTFSLVNYKPVEKRKLLFFPLVKRQKVYEKEVLRCWCCLAVAGGTGGSIRKV